jgi:hypothetical protein
MLINTNEYLEKLKSSEVTEYVTELCCPDCLSDVVTRKIYDHVVGVTAILKLECESCGKVFHVGLKRKGVLK